MLNFFQKLFSSDFMPHGHCYFWRPEVVWLHVASDAAITLSYYSIPIALWYLVRHRKDLAFNWMFGCFAAFIFLCGTTHLFQIWTLWNPTYRLEGVVKAITGAISLITAALLIPLIPKVLSLPTQRQLEEANNALRLQVEEREAAEAQVHQLNTELEERVRERTAALQRSNDDLAQFAYVASHDLQEPLRNVASFTQLLERRYKGRLDQEADLYINFAVEGARRMQFLIEDLLAFSRVDHSQNMLTLGADECLDQALKILQGAIEESKAQIIRTKLPIVQADCLQLSQIFQNLIGNSIKYRSERPLRIEIGAREKDGEWVFSVRDNGIGFDQDHAARVFDVFTRLHRNANSGTGIGLAVVKKIVSRHGGRIWCDGEEGAGATFYFTLPQIVQTPVYSMNSTT